jgi:hypothetical protein
MNIPRWLAYGTMALLGAQSVWGQFGGGSGSALDPYLVGNATHLNNVRNSASSHFRQTANITLSGEWTPIASFTGTYDGDHYTIGGLSVSGSASGSNNRGLFGQTSGAAVLRNIRLENGTVNVTGSNSFDTGALVGQAIGTTRIENCYSKVNVTGRTRVGGLVGMVLGNSDANRVIIRNCYAWGNVSGDGSVAAGGLVGYLDRGTIEYCYAKGVVSGANSGGLVAFVAAPYTVTSSFWDTQVSGQPGSAAGTGQTTAQLMTQATFSGWDIASLATATWLIVPGASYPFFTQRTPQAAQPTFSPNGGAFPGSSLNVTVSQNEAGAIIRYTSGSAVPADPNWSSTSVAHGGSVSVPVPGTLKARAWRPYYQPSAVRSAAYTAARQAQTPAFAPDGGAHPGTSVTVTVTSEAGAAIRYTTNGADPTEASALVPGGGQVSVAIGQTLKARAYHASYNPSNIKSAIYTAAPTAQTPTFDPDGGVHVGTQVVVKVASATAGATIRYTTNGANPTEASTLVPASSNVAVTVGQTLKARAYYTGYNPSAIKSATYSAQRATVTPTFNPTGGVHVGTSVWVSVATEAGATIYYTINGGAPTPASPQVGAGGQVAVPIPGVLRARAYHPSYNPSAVATGVYSAAVSVMPPQFAPPAGTYRGDSLEVTITVATNDATIHYTTNGIDPTPASPTLANGASVTVALPGILKAIATRPGFNASAVTSASYTHFDVGAGTPGDPYRIANADHLYNVRYHLGEHFRMINDVDLAAAGITNWPPVGATNAPFAGAFDGDGHAIRNLNVMTGSHAGLFGVIGTNGMVTKLGLVGGSVTGSLMSGRWRASIEEGFLTAFATCNVFGDEYVGGQVGSRIYRMAQSVTVIRLEWSRSSTNYGGGLIGFNAGGRLSIRFQLANYLAMSLIKGA